MPDIYVSLTFRLEEPVTPDHLASRVAEACFSHGALRSGEAVVFPDGSGRELRDAGPIDRNLLKHLLPFVQGDDNG